MVLLFCSLVLSELFRHGTFRVSGLNILSPLSIGMPSKHIVCEFCNHTHRKDRLGQHVKVRHVKQLAERFTAQLEQKENPISSIIHSNRIVRIYSQQDPKAFYVFGVIGRYFEENDACDQYIEDNTEQHNLFLSMVLSHIPLSVFLRSSFIHGDLVRKNRILKEENERLSAIIQVWLKI